MNKPPERLTMTDTDIGTLEQEIRQVRARLARVEGERDELLAELQKCAEVFRRYEQIHLLKCSDEGNDKAHENACLAARAEAVISNVKGGA